MTTKDTESPVPPSPSRSASGDPLEALVARMMRERESGTLRFEDSEGGAHALTVRDGVRVTLRSSCAAPRLEPAAPGEGSVAESPAGGAPQSPAERAARVEEEMRLAEEIFRRSASTAKITLDETPEDVSPNAVWLDAFDLLYRGVRARGRDAPLALAIEGAARPFVLHRDAAVDTFPLRPAERKMVGLIANLARSLDDLRARHLLPEDELITFLHFLVLTHNAFQVGDETAHLAPLGDLTPEERLLREPMPESSTELPAFASRAGLAVLGLALVPLAVSLLSKPEDISSRLERTILAHPELAPLFDQKTPTMGELLRALPDGKLDGALLSYGSMAHLFYALGAAVMFLAVLLTLFQRGRARIKELPLVALFTGTAGVLFLLLVQWVAEHLQGVNIVPGGLASGIAAMMIYAVKFIGMSYNAASDPRNGLLLSFLGFTAGVGLCEEIVKVLPVRDHFRRRGTLDLHGAIAWGLASGIGLGVTEGLMYSAQHYNGLRPLLTYVVRFVSCVALHAIWSATTAIAVYERRRELHLGGNILHRISMLLAIIAVPMVLHGLYDTLLKRGLDVAALAVALVSFGYLAVRLARVRLAPRRPEPGAT